MEWKKARTHGDLGESGKRGKGKWNISIFGPFEATCTCMKIVCCLVIKGMKGGVARVWESYAIRK